jgi:hypothetical protein
MRMTERKHLPGVTGIVCALGLNQKCRDRLLDCFHSCATRLDELCALWTRVIIACREGFLVGSNGELVLLRDAHVRHEDTRGGTTASEVGVNLHSRPFLPGCRHGRRLPGKLLCHSGAKIIFEKHFTSILTANIMADYAYWT